MALDTHTIKTLLFDVSECERVEVLLEAMVKMTKMNRFPTLL